VKLRILGTNNMSSLTTRWPAYLIDGRLALDAGSLARSLTFEEQGGIRAVVLSHRHVDHTFDLVPFGLNATVYKWPAVNVYGIQDTIDSLRTGLLGGIAPVLIDAQGEGHAALNLNVIDYRQETTVLDYSIMAVPVPHAVEAAGIQVTVGGTKLFYTGDAGQGLSETWKHLAPDVLLTECSHGDENRAHALRVGHLTPGLIKETLVDFKGRHGYLPKVLVTHINPPWEEAVRRELAVVSEELGHEILVTESDMIFDLGS
jgi:ribonuclease BN (tRNA processing enzyme)